MVIFDRHSYRSMYTYRTQLLCLDHKKTEHSEVTYNSVVHYHLQNTPIPLMSNVAEPPVLRPIFKVL